MLTAEPTLCPRDMELPSSLVHKMFMMSLGDAACLYNIQVLLWNFSKKVSGKQEPRCSPWTHEPINVVVRRVGFEQSDQCVIVCAQNVSGMVSRVEGTRYRCPWGQSPPAALPLSQNQTSALAAIPFSRILSSQDRFGAARGRFRRGVQPVVREERETRGQRLLPTGD